MDDFSGWTHGWLADGIDWFDGLHMYPCIWYESSVFAESVVSSERHDDLGTIILYLFPHHHLLQNAECGTELKLLTLLEFSVHTPFVYVLIPKTSRAIYLSSVRILVSNTVSLMRLRTENIGNRFFFSEQTHVTDFCVPNIAFLFKILVY